MADSIGVVARPRLPVPMVGCGLGVDKETSISGPMESTGSTVLSNLAAAELAAAQQGRSSRGFEDEILRIESRVPGVGGVYVDSSGFVNVWLQNLANSPLVLQELSCLASNPRSRGKLQEAILAGRVRFLAATFSFSELVAGNRVIGGGGHNPSIIGVDADEALNRVRVSVPHDVDVEEIRTALETLPLPDSIVTIIRTHRATSLTLGDRHRPTGGGIQIRNGSSARCTLGFNVITLFYADTAFLTAAHCDSGPMGYGATGGQIYQNNASAADSIGRVHINPLWNRTDTDCRGFSLCTLADVMLVRASPVSSWSKRVAETLSFGINNANGSITLYGWFTPATLVPFLYVGADVYKVGRTTGYTRGTLTATCDNLT